MGNLLGKTSREGIQNEQLQGNSSPQGGNEAPLIPALRCVLWLVK